MSADEITHDIFEGDFPPENYGTNLDEVETIVQRAVDDLFFDKDGILLGAVNARTMKPYRNADVKDRIDGVGTFVEHAKIPRSVKAIRANYENSIQVSGVFLGALCAKAGATGGMASRDPAAGIVAAIATLWANAALIQYPLGGGGKGWLPKPYGGIHEVENMHECSVDQYCDITLGLHSYYQVFASEREKRQIEEIIVSFADWWYEHDFACVYQGEAIWYKLLPDHSMATSFFLYLFALANSWCPSRRFQHGFEIWQERLDTLRAADEAIWICMNGLPLDCMTRLVDLRPEYIDFWRAIAEHHAQFVVASVEKQPGMNRMYEIEGLAANYLMAANQIIPHSGYDTIAVKYLHRVSDRKQFYHLRRGLHLKDLDPRKCGDDCRDMFSCEIHVHWLSAYWKLRKNGALPE
jgi:hypothetical protein